MFLKRVVRLEQRDQVLALVLSGLAILAIPCKAQLQQTATAIAPSSSIQNVGSLLKLSAVVTSASGIAPSGTVQFLDGNTPLATQPLVAASGSNLLPYSLPSSHWQLVGDGNIVPGSKQAPDGSTTASTLEFTGSTDSSVSQTVACVDQSVPYLFSVWLKADATTLVTYLSVGGLNPSQVPKQITVASSWQRYSLLGKLDPEDGVIVVSIGGSGSFGPGKSAGSLHIWGAQLEGVRPGPYLSTSGSSGISGTATNLLPFSSAGSQWYTSGDSGALDALNGGDLLTGDADPEGTYTTSEYRFDGTAVSSLYFDVGPQAGSPEYTFSIWARVPPGQQILSTQLAILSSGAVIANAPITIQNYWSRYSVSANVPLQSNVSVALGGDLTFGPDKPRGALEFWGAQMEQGVAVPGPLVNTNGSPLTERYTNLIPSSIDAGAWLVSGSGSVLPNAFTDPVGTKTAFGVTFGPSQNTLLLQTVPVSDPTQPHIFSVWLRVPSGQLSTYLTIWDQNGSQVSAPVSLTTIWQRFSVAGTLLAGATSLKVGIGSAYPTGVCPAATCPSGTFEVWGPQLEPIIPGPYIPTDGAPSTVSIGRVSFETNTLPVGVHEISARYSGDTYSSSSTSLLTQVTVLDHGAPPDQALVLTCLPAIVIQGQGFDCTARMPMGTSGSAAFSIDNQAWTTLTLLPSGSAVANQTASNLTVGNHQITVTYSGNMGSATQTANVLVMAPGTTAPSGALLYHFEIPSSGYDGAGNITAYTDSVDGKWNLGYDQLNRLTSAVATTPYSAPLNMSWTYDAFGNRLTQTNDPFSTWARYDANNQVSATQRLPSGIPASTGTMASNGMFDAAGNMIDDGDTYFAYDAEGHLCASQPHSSGGRTVTGYLYDATGARVAKGTLSLPPGTGLVCPTALPAAAFQAITLYSEGPDGRPMAEYAKDGTWIRSYVYDSAGLLASTDMSGTHFQLRDWLGTRRVQTDAIGRVEGRFHNTPFGDGFAIEGLDGASGHFTGKQRDEESGLDYFGARYYEPSMGRFMSPDPSNVGIDFAIPQSWNLYAYVLNNPLVAVDRNGLWPTRIHEQIIDNAFPGLTPGQRQALKNASYDVDHAPGSQETVNAYQHSMSEGDWADDHHEQRTADFIKGNESNAQSLQAQWADMGGANIAPTALLKFGAALHTISDGTSPAHEGFQKWYGLWHVSSAWHWLREQYISPARMDQAVTAERAAFRETFGDQFYWWATSQQQPLDQPQMKVTVTPIWDSVHVIP